MQIKKDKIMLRDENFILDNNPDEFNASKLEKNEKILRHYMETALLHLTSLKSELYTIVDTEIENAISFKTGLEDNPNHKHGADSVNYEERPSEFLEKAYATQTYDAQGNALENRYQGYIDAGVAFDVFCKNELNLNANHRLLNDIGLVLSSMNNIVSQINRLEADLAKKEYEHAALVAAQINTFVNVAITAAEESNVVTVKEAKTHFQKVLSKIMDIYISLRNWFTTMITGHAPVNEKKEQNTFQSLKEKYQHVADDMKTPELSVDESGDQENDVSFSNRPSQ